MLVYEPKHHNMRDQKQLLYYIWMTLYSKIEWSNQNCCTTVALVRSFLTRFCYSLGPINIKCIRPHIWIDLNLNKKLRNGMMKNHKTIWLWIHKTHTYDYWTKLIFLFQSVGGPEDLQCILASCPLLFKSSDDKRMKNDNLFSVIFYGNHNLERRS